MCTHHTPSRYAFRPPGKQTIGHASARPTKDSDMQTQRGGYVCRQAGNRTDKGAGARVRAGRRRKKQIGRQKVRQTHITTDRRQRLATCRQTQTSDTPGRQSSKPTTAFTHGHANMHPQGQTCLQAIRTTRRQTGRQTHRCATMQTDKQIWRTGGATCTYTAAHACVHSGGQSGMILCP